MGSHAVVVLSSATILERLCHSSSVCTRSLYKRRRMVSLVHYDPARLSSTIRVIVDMLVGNQK